MISDGFENDLCSVSDTDESEENPSYTKLLVSFWHKTLECRIRDLPKKEFAKVLHGLLSDILKREKDYIETPLII